MVDSKFRWVPQFRGQSVPEDAVLGGTERNGSPLYVARTNFNGSLTPGKVGGPFDGIKFSYGGAAHQSDEYEVLCGPGDLVEWKECCGQFYLDDWLPMDCGCENNGLPLYVAKTRFHGGEVIGKIGPHMLDGMAFGFNHMEERTGAYEPYYVLSVST